MFFFFFMHLWVTFLIEHIKFIRCIIFQPVSSWSIAGIFCVRTQAAFLVMSVICELRCVMFHFESVIRLRVTCGCLCCCGLVYRLLFFFLHGIATQRKSSFPDMERLVASPLWFANVDFVFEYIYQVFEFKEGFKKARNRPLTGLWSKGYIPDSHWLSQEGH